MVRNLSPEEKKKWILENCIDEDGHIDLNDLNFSDCDKNIYMNNMKVQRNLWLDELKVGEDLIQTWLKVKGKIYQD